MRRLRGGPVVRRVLLIGAALTLAGVLSACGAGAPKLPDQYALADDLLRKQVAGAQLVYERNKTLPINAGFEGASTPRRRR